MIGKIILLSIFMLLLACGGGSSAGNNSSGYLGDTAIQLSDVLIVDMATGNIEARVDLPSDVLSNPAYRSSQMIFRRIEAGSVAGGGYPYFDIDENRGTVSSGVIYVAIFEATQGHWAAAMGGSDTPWIFTNSGSIVPVLNANDIPVYNVSQQDAEAFAAQLQSSTGVSITLPTDDQWEYVCRAGSTSLYTWGGNDSLSNVGSESPSTLVNNANVFQTNSAGEGPSAAGSGTALAPTVKRGPNAFGLYDMHGNVFEWTSDDSLRGGSWADTIFACRSANKVFVDVDTAHPLAGVRLVINP